MIRHQIQLVVSHVPGLRPDLVQNPSGKSPVPIPLLHIQGAEIGGQILPAVEIIVDHSCAGRNVSLFIDQYIPLRDSLFLPQAPLHTFQINFFSNPPFFGKPFSRRLQKFPAIPKPAKFQTSAVLLQLPPQKRFFFQLFYKGILSLAVSFDIIGKFFRQTGLKTSISLRLRSVAPEIIPDRQMPPDLLLILFFKYMDLMGPLISSLPEISAAADPHLSHAFITQLFKQGTAFIHPIQTSDHSQYINDGLGLQPRHGCAADVIQGKTFFSQDFLKGRCLLLKLLFPGRIVRDYGNMLHLFLLFLHSEMTSIHLDQPFPLHFPQLRGHGGPVHPQVIRQLLPVKGDVKLPAALFDCLPGQIR